MCVHSVGGGGGGGERRVYATDYWYDNSDCSCGGVAV